MKLKQQIVLISESTTDEFNTRVNDLIEGGYQFTIKETDENIYHVQLVKPLGNLVVTTQPLKYSQLFEVIYQL